MGDYMRGAQPFHDPPVPFHCPISGGLFPGKEIYIQGTVNGDAEQFKVDLRCSRQPGPDCCLHLNPRFGYSGTDWDVVLNNCVGGEWGPEERYPNQFFAKGSPFDITIRPEGHGYAFVVNGTECCTFAHREAMDLVDELSIDGDVAISSINFRTTTMHGPPTPFITQIPGGTKPGRLIFLDVHVPHGSQGFKVNLKSGPEQDETNVPFHWNPRLDEGQVVRNTCQNGEWGDEERDGPFPFHPGTNLNLAFYIDYNSVKVAVNGMHLTEYTNRAPIHLMDHVFVEGDIHIQGIRFE